MFVAILIAWNLPILRDIIAGLKVRSLVTILGVETDMTAFHRWSSRTLSPRCRTAVRRSGGFNMYRPK